MAGRRQAANKSEEWERFGRRVGELRVAAGLSYNDLAMREVFAADEFRRVEEGLTVPPRHIAEYLDGELKAQSRVVNAWARSLLNVHLESGARPHELDSSVSALREFHPGALPASLQSHDYASALGLGRADSTGAGPSSWNRMARQRVVLNETVVRAQVGGAKVMREQLRSLISSMRGSGLCLQVVPADITEHPCPMGPFRLLSLGPVYTVAHLLSPCGDGQLITAPEEVRAFTDLFEDLRGAALPVSESLDLLVHVAESLKPRAEQKAITGGGGEGDRVLSTLPTHQFARR